MPLTPYQVQLQAAHAFGEPSGAAAAEETAGMGPAAADLTPYADPVPQIVQDPWRNMTGDPPLPIIADAISETWSSGTDPDMPGLQPPLPSQQSQPQDGILVVAPGLFGAAQRVIAQ